MIDIIKGICSYYVTIPSLMENELPTALPDLAVTTAGSSIAIAVLANDTGTSLSLAGFTSPANGSVTQGANNNLIYTPESEFSGSDSFFYTVIDGSGQTAQAEVTITVIEPNDTPIAVDDAIEIFEGNQAIIPILANDSDPDGDAIVLAAIAMPSHGSIEVLSDQTVRYTAQPGFTGFDSFQYTIIDERGSFANATVTINVRSHNQAPIALADYVDATVGQSIVISPLINDSDPDGDEVQLVGYTLPGLGTLSLNGDGQTFTYTGSSVGNDGFTYTIRDSAANTVSAFVSIMVADANSIPVPQDDVAETNRDTAVTIDVLTNDSDADSDSLSIVALSLPSFGRLEVNPDQTLLYTPLAGVSGVDEFVYTIRDTKGASATGRVVVTINDTGEAYLNGFSAKRRIIVPPQAENTIVAEDYVLMVALTDIDLSLVGNGGRLRSPDGFDVRFETATGDALDHDVEVHDLLTGEFRCWVRIPSWDMNERLELSIYYDNPAISADTSDPAAVWQGYVARWNATSGTDSTGNGRNLTVDNVVTGNLVGPAGDYDGNAVMSLSDSSFQNGLSEFTVQAIVKAGAGSIGTDSGILTEGTITGSDTPAGITLQYLASTASGVPNVIHLKARCTDGNAFVLSSQNRHTDARQVIHGTWKAGEVPKLYLDGDFENSSASSVARNGPTVATGPFYIGAGPRDSANGGWDGLIDEVRITNRAISADVIASEAVNLATPELFYGLGNREQPSDQQLPPIAVPIRSDILNGAVANIDVLDASFDANGDDTLTISNVGTPANGSASVVGNIIRYVPNSGFVGTDQFTYSISDGNSQSTATIQVEVTEVATLDAILPNGKRVLLMNETPLRTIVATTSTIQNVLNAALPGDLILLRDGTYGAFSMSRSGTELAPIVIAAQTSQGATLSAQVTVTGSWLKFDNLEITNGGHFEAFAPSTNVRFDRCTFENNTNSGIRLWADVENVRVSRCVGRNGREFFIYCDINTPQPPGGPIYVHIDHSYFTGYNTKSCIRLGDTSLKDGPFELNAVVEYNYFDSNTGHRELIVGKSSRNWVRYNTITGASRGDIAIRQGAHWNIYGNYMIGAGGITTVAIDNNVYNNYIAGGVRGIWMMPGDNIWGQDTDQRPIYPRTDSSVIANNTIVMTERTSEGIGVGKGFGQVKYDVINCDIVNNLVLRLAGSSLPIERIAESSNRFANNIVSVNSGYTGAGVTVANPLLTLEDGVYRPTQASPMRGAGTPISNYGPTGLTIVDDIDGTERGTSFDVGAEQFSSAMPPRAMIQQSDVGILVSDPYQDD